MPNSYYIYMYIIGKLCTHLVNLDIIGKLRTQLVNLESTNSLSIPFLGKEEVLLIVIVFVLTHIMS